MPKPPKYIVIDGYVFRFARIDKGGFYIYRNRWGDETVATDWEMKRGSDNLEDLKGVRTDEISN